MDHKPFCPLLGADGNIFNVMGLASRTLKDHGMKDQAAEMRERVMQSGDYNQALGIIMEYVEPVGAEEMSENCGCDEEMDEGCEPSMDW